MLVGELLSLAIEHHGSYLNWHGFWMLSFFVAYEANSRHPPSLSVSCYPNYIGLEKGLVRPCLLHSFVTSLLLKQGLVLLTLRSE